MVSFANFGLLRENKSKENHGDWTIRKNLPENKESRKNNYKTSEKFLNKNLVFNNDLH